MIGGLYLFRVGEESPKGRRGYNIPARDVKFIQLEFHPHPGRRGHNIPARDVQPVKVRVLHTLRKQSAHKAKRAEELCASCYDKGENYELFCCNRSSFALDYSCIISPLLWYVKRFL